MLFSWDNGTFNGVFEMPQVKTLHGSMVTLMVVDFKEEYGKMVYFRW
jgi:hypothetical protein